MHRNNLYSVLLHAETPSSSFKVVFPPALIYFYLHAEEMYEEYGEAPWLAEVVLYVGMPMCEFVFFFCILHIVFDLFDSDSYHIVLLQVRRQ